MKNSPWFDAFMDPAAILLVISSIISGLIAAWWLFLVGIVLWLILVVKALRDPFLRINKAIQNRSELTQRFQSKFNQLQKSQVSFFNTIQSSEPGIQRELLAINECITQLVDVVYENCRRYSLLENHRMVSTSNQKMEEDLASINERLLTVDSVTDRSRLETLQKSLIDKITQQKKVTDQLDKYSNELSVIQNQLDGFITQALQAQSTGEEELKKDLPVIQKEIIALIAQVEK